MKNDLTIFFQAAEMATFTTLMDVGILGLHTVGKQDFPSI